MIESKNELKAIEQQAKKIKELQTELVGLSDEELKTSFANLCGFYRAQKIDKTDFQNQVYAIVCEVAKRVLQKDPYLVQVMGAICLNNGDVAAMATGEGKTLTSTMPAVLNAITEGSVHIATANEYLAQRDAEEMGKVYKFLGLSVGIVYAGQKLEDKQKAYACDITYGTGTEFGFDYLRDQICYSTKHLSGQKHGFAIVDEVDEILIDEATIPMIISEQVNVKKENFVMADEFVRTLSPEDYEIDSQDESVSLTESGFDKLEQKFEKTMTEEEFLNIRFFVSNALKAHFVLKKNDDYVVENNEILLVDKHTGRIMVGREYSDFLQQAIQIKEGVEYKAPTRSRASISYQKYYTKYAKLSGMTGTTENAEDEFLTYYNMRVYKIPSNKPNVRIDEPPRVYISKRFQLEAILKEVRMAKSTGQPILIGTTTIEQSEEIANLLEENGIECNVLNANTKHEADIISCAGMIGQVTIATNIAGRGTDIKLGGDPEILTEMFLERKGIQLTEEQKAIIFASEYDSSDEMLDMARNIYLRVCENCKKEKLKVNELGGLRVVGTTLGASPRVTKQLTGRSGRQGDNGSSVLIVSVYDEILFRHCSGELSALSTSGEIEKMVDPRTGLINDKKVVGLVELAESRCDAQSKAVRETNVRIENILDPKRSGVYGERRELLECDDVSQYIEHYVYQVVLRQINEGLSVSELSEFLNNIFGACAPKLEMKTNLTPEQIAEQITQKIMQNKHQMQEQLITGKNKKLAAKLLDEKEKFIMIMTMDEFWTEFLNGVNETKQGSFLQALVNIDPYREFMIKSADDFKFIVQLAQIETLKKIFGDSGLVGSELSTNTPKTKD